MRNLSLSATRTRPKPRPNGRAFWDFSLALYGRGKVADCCLELQDRRGLDVNLILYCCWLASAGIAIEAGHIVVAEKRLRRWRRRVIQPLRRLRRELKEDPMGMPVRAAERVRRRIAEAELAAERVAQMALAGLTPTGRPIAATRPNRLAAANLRTYFAHAGIRPGAAERRAIATLAKATG